MTAEPKLWVCDFCGGPASWTFFPGDPVPWYKCQRQCDGFMQMELWEPESVDPARGSETGTTNADEQTLN